MLFNIQELHIEISSKCTLKCPRCPRTELDLEHLNKEISVQEFQKSFSTELLDKVEKITLCGDVGDPIYAKDFLPIVEYIKQNSKVRLYIITNGSYKSSNWWECLGNLLDERDQIQFSIDGWDHNSNQQYRVNSDWESITQGARVFRQKSTAKMIWSTIYFNFNEDRIDQIEKTARDLGFDVLETVKSSKFDGKYLVNGVDLLKPKQIAKTSQYERSMTLLNRPLVASTQRQNTQQHAWAKCLNHQKQLFINVEGLVFPCPWFNSGYHINEFVQRNKDKITIKTRSLLEILNDPVWQELVNSFDHNPLQVCQMKCKNAQ